MEQHDDFDAVLSEVEQYDKRFIKRGGIVWLRRFGTGLYRLRNKAMIETFMELTEGLPEIRVFEFACGDPFFAKTVLERVEVEKYVISDFSPIVLELVHEELDYYAQCEMKLMDARKLVESDFAGFNVIMCLGLEHIQNDLEIISKMPRDAFFFFSTSNASWDSHYRWFLSKEGIEQQYNKLLEILDISTVTWPANGAAKWIVMTRVR